MLIMCNLLERKQKTTAFNSLTSKKAFCARQSIVLVLTEDNEALFGQRVKRVGNNDFVCQNSGVMNCLPIPAENGLHRSTVSSEAPS